MTIGRAVVAALFAALPIGSALWLASRVRRERALPLTLVAKLLAAGALAAAAVLFVERAVFRFGDLSIEATRSSSVSAFLTLLLFVVPFEEAAVAAMTWPVVRKRRPEGPGITIPLAVCVAAGFAAVTLPAFLVTGALILLPAIRALAALPAHLFCAGLWGYALSGRQRQGRWFVPVWLMAVAIRALYDHIVFGRGPGMLVVALPMLLAMGLLGAGALRDLVPAVEEDWSRLPVHLPEPPSLGAMRRVLAPSDRPLKLRWIVFGALVNVGAVLVSIAVAVFFARRMGIDLGMADETDMRSNGPLILLGTALLGAFPVSGYLVARASGTHSVLEPAFASGLAIAGAVFALSVTAPSAVIFSLAVAPIAFGLACGGAWFGIGQ